MITTMLKTFATGIIGVDPNAGNGTDTTTIHNVPTTSATDVFTNTLNIVYGLIGSAAIIVIIAAGIIYATSGGNATNITRAKNALLYAIIGLVITLLAFTITQFIAGRIHA